MNEVKEKVIKTLLVGTNLLMPYDDWYLYIIDLPEANQTRITKHQAKQIADFLQEWVNEGE